jgi:hypothetical protein
MKALKNNSSAATCREPFGPVTDLMHVPIALFEILSLAEEIDHPEARRIAALAGSVITVTLDDPEALVKLGQGILPTPSNLERNSNSIGDG